MKFSAVRKYWTLVEAKHDPGAISLLDAAYRESHRAYHDWRHISDLLEKLDQLQSLATRVDLVATAIFWHDAVYVTREPDGEFRPDAINVHASAALFAQHSKFNREDTDAVVDMILATINHLNARPSWERYHGFTDDFDLFLDLDLSSLAAPWSVFKENLARIRHEYSFAPEIEFCTGRLKMVRNFIAYGERLFRREPTRRLWLTPALQNLRRGVNELEAQLGALQSSAGEARR